jgi:aspartyl-tRNA synthetase
MVAGFDKYFQIARCYRDEDARGDRQPEFTQIDIEMSFVGREDVLAMTEGLMAHVFKKTMNVELPAHFTRLTYDEALERYGTDKPDLRFGLEIQDFAPYVEAGGFQAFKDALAQGEADRQTAAAKGVTIPGGGVKALVVPGKAMGETSYSRKQIEELEAQAKIYKAKGMAWMKVNGTEAAPVLEGGVAKFFGDQAAAITAGLGAKPGDLILIVADARRKVANIALGAVRSKLGKDLGLAGATVPGCNTAGAAAVPGGGAVSGTGAAAPSGSTAVNKAKAGASAVDSPDAARPPRFEFAWIVDFPLFEFNEEENRWEAAHHMFSYPQEQYHATLEQDPGAVKGDLYDLVLNGYELASGSIRIHDSELQKRIFNIVGIPPAEAETKFGFLTEAFKYGAPPHGGIAPGLDRLVMLMAGETSIKEVIAFPKNSFAVSPMDDSPGEVDQKQLDELHLSIVYPEQKNTP